MFELQVERFYLKNIAYVPFTKKNKINRTDIANLFIEARK